MMNAISFQRKLADTFTDFYNSGTGTNEFLIIPFIPVNWQHASLLESFSYTLDYFLRLWRLFSHIFLSSTV
jgi:hypothetical protein